MSLFIFPYLSVFSQLVVVLVVIRNRKLLTFEMRTLGVYFILGLAVDISQVVMALRGEHNLWIFYFFFPIQFALLMLVFYFWNRSSALAKVMLFSIPVMVVVWSFGPAWFKSLENTLTYVDPASSVMLVFAASYTLLASDRMEESSVVELPAFWASAATVIYFGATIVWSSLSSTILKVSDPEIKRLAWSTQSVVTILANFMFAGAFLCLRRKT